MQIATRDASCYTYGRKQKTYEKGNEDMATTSVRIDESIVKRATAIGQALSRTPPKQIEHWVKIGQMMEDNPDLTYEFVMQSIISKAELDMGQTEKYDFD